MACEKKNTCTSKGKEPQIKLQLLTEQIAWLTRGIARMQEIVLELQWSWSSAHTPEQQEQIIWEYARRARA